LININIGRETIQFQWEKARRFFDGKITVLRDASAHVARNGDFTNIHGNLRGCDNFREPLWGATCDVEGARFGRLGPRALD
jgi:hypothetical protein